MTETKPFPTIYLLSLVSDRVLIEGSIDLELEILSWMTGGEVYLHQYPRLAREAVPHILWLHPHLRQVIEEAGSITPENALAWRETWIARYGPEITVPKLAPEQFERIDPASELCETTHPDRVIPIRDSKTPGA